MDDGAQSLWETINYYFTDFVIFKIQDVGITISHIVVAVLAVVTTTSTKTFGTNHGRVKGRELFASGFPVDVIVLIDKCPITIGCVPLLKV